MLIIWRNAAFTSIQEFFPSSMPDTGRSAMANTDNIEGIFESKNFEANIPGFISTLLCDGSSLMPNTTTTNGMC